MPARKNDIDLNTVLLIGAGIMVLPIIKGLFKAAKTAGDIIAAPSDFINWMNNQTDQVIDNAFKNLVWKVTTETTYQPTKQDAVSFRQIIEQSDLFSNNEKILIISNWKMPKADLFKDLIKQQLQKFVNDFAKGFF